MAGHDCISTRRRRPRRTYESKHQLPRRVSCCGAAVQNAASCEARDGVVIRAVQCGCIDHPLSEYVLLSLFFFFFFFFLFYYVCASPNFMLPSKTKVCGTITSGGTESIIMVSLFENKQKIHITHQHLVKSRTPDGACRLPCNGGCSTVTSDAICQKQKLTESILTLALLFLSPPTSCI